MATRRKLFIEYLRLYLFFAAFSPGMYFGIKAYQEDSNLLYALGIIAIFSAISLLLKMPDVVGDTESYPQ